MTDAEIVARMRKALATWQAQAEGMRKAAAADLEKNNIEGAISMAQQAVVIEAMAAFLHKLLE
jgi:hypothetical protein